jgi:hypothetical protein
VTCKTLSNLTTATSKYEMIVLLFYFISLVLTTLSVEYARQVIVVAGNFSIDGETVNIAQYDTVTGLYVFF